MPRRAGALKRTAAPILGAAALAATGCGSGSETGAENAVDASGRGETLSKPAARGDRAGGDGDRGAARPRSAREARESRRERRSARRRQRDERRLRAGRDNDSRGGQGAGDSPTPVTELDDGRDGPAPTENQPTGSKRRPAAHGDDRNGRARGQ